MTDRESIMFLTRASEALVQRGRDIRYMQEHQDAEHCRLLQDLLGVVDRMRQAIIGEIREFSPPEADVQGRAAIGHSLQEQQHEAMAQAKAERETAHRMVERERKLAVNRGSLPRDV